PYRPESKPPCPATDRQTSLALTRLNRRQVGDLMRKKAGGALPETVIQQVYDRAGGVPLFVEEFTRMVQESAGDANAPALTGHGIPSTLQDLGMARLDRAEAGGGRGGAGGGGGGERAERAAVLGREFGYELLAAVATVDEPTLQAELARLTHAEILYSKGRPPRGTYIFKHS